MMQVISTNCMIARKSSSPSFCAMLWSSGLNCRSTATPPPTATANRHIADHDVGADGEHQQHGYVRW